MIASLDFSKSVCEGEEGLLMRFISTCKKGGRGRSQKGTTKNLQWKIYKLLLYIAIGHTRVYMKIAFLTATIFTYAI